MIGSTVKWAVAGLGRADLRLRTYVNARGRKHGNNVDLVIGLFIVTIALATAGLKPLVVITAVALFGLGWVGASTPNQPSRTPSSSSSVLAKLASPAATRFAMTLLCLLPAFMLLGVAASPVAWFFIFLAARRRNQLRNTAQSGEVAALVR